MKKTITLCAIFLALFVNIKAQNIVITEIMYNSPEAGTDSLEFIEIYNSDTVDYNLEGYFFSSGVTFTFPNYTLMANTYALLAVDSIAFSNFYGVNPDFEWTSGALSNSGEAITLKDSSLNIIDSVYFEDSTPWPIDADGFGGSLNLCNISTDNNMVENWSVNMVNYIGTIDSIDIYATPGMASNCYANTLVISEIMFNSPESGTDSLEFIEIYNNSTMTFNIEGVHFSQGINFEFPYYVMLPNEYIVLAVDSEAFHNFYGSAPTFSWDYNGALNNDGETIEINDVDNMFIDSVDYGDSSPWFSEADANGFSLSLCDVTLDNSLATSWSIDSSNYIGTIDTVEVFASPFSDCGKIITSTKENTLETLSTVYPNPVTNTLYIKSSFTNIKTQIIDLQGQVLLTSTHPVIDLSALKSGIYIVRSEYGTKINHVSIIKN